MAFALAASGACAAPSYPECPTSLMRVLKTILLAAGLVLVGVPSIASARGPIVETPRAPDVVAIVALVCAPYALISAVDTLGWRFRVRPRSRAVPRAARPHASPARR